MGYIQKTLCGDMPLGDFSPVRIMGIVNLSPESFYPDSFVPNNSLIPTINSFLEHGASFIDLGARSTAPWVEKITLEEEVLRMKGALNEIKEIFPKDKILSIDTQYSRVARMALEFGERNRIKTIINDISSFTTDPELLDVIVEFGCPVIIMATHRIPGDAKTIPGILDALAKTLTQLRKKSYDLSKVIIDPGIGKWDKEKTYEYDLEILDNLGKFRRLGLPVLVGLARKSFIGTTLGVKNSADRGVGSLAATAIAVYNGAHIIRTHDVDFSMSQTIRMGSAIRRKLDNAKENPITLNLEDMVREIKKKANSADETKNYYGV